jgi:hypothetical protein
MQLRNEFVGAASELLLAHDLLMTGGCSGSRDSRSLARVAAQCGRMSRVLVAGVQDQAIGGSERAKDSRSVTGGH